MNAIRLHRILLDAVEHVPFYRQHWRAAGVDLTRIASAVHLEFLPVVRKTDLLACPAELRIDQRFLARTLNTSCAQPGELPVDPVALRQRRKRFVRALRDVGYSPGERLMLITEPPFPAGAGLLRWTYVDSRAPETELFARFVRARPQVLYGPLSSLLRIARRMLTTPDVRFRPRLVISTAEQLTDAQRTLLESAFSARVADFYSIRELGLIAYTRPGRAAYEVQERDYHVEFLPVEAGSPFERLVVTDLNAGAVPLIRFDTGDLVRRDRERPGAPIVEIRGREAPALEPANGAWLSPEEVAVALERMDGEPRHPHAGPEEAGADLGRLPPRPATPLLGLLAGARLQPR